MIKDTYEYPDEKIHRARSVSTEASVSMELGYISLLIGRCVCQPESAPNPILMQFLWRLHRIGMPDY